jgi:hypothetical protein
MLKNEQLKQWGCIVSERMPHLTIPGVVRAILGSLRPQPVVKVSMIEAIINSRFSGF